MRSAINDQASIEVRETGVIMGVILVLLTLPGVVIAWVRGLAVIAIPLLLFTLVIALAFSSMQLIVRNGRVRVKLGNLITVKNVAFADVMSVRRITPPRWAGLGIRIMKEGMLYTLTWGDAVEFTLRNGSKFFVGLSNPDDFCKRVQPVVQP